MLFSENLQKNPASCVFICERQPGGIPADGGTGFPGRCRDRNKNKEHGGKYSTMKKKMIVLAMFSLLLLALIPSAMAACDHTYGPWHVSKPATCTETGTKISKCTKCGAGGIYVIPKLGHNWKDATCTSAKKCTRCGETKGEKLGHDWGSWKTTTAATCTKEGIKERKCKRSGCTKTQTQTIDKLNHSWTEWEGYSSVCEGTSQSRYCTRCGRGEGRLAEGRGHIYSSWEVVRPACHPEGGLRQSVCDRCGKVLTVSVSPAAHTFGEWITMQPACHPDGGFQFRGCQACGMVDSQRLAHVNHAGAGFQDVYDESGKLTGRNFVCPQCGIFAMPYFADETPSNPVDPDTQQHFFDLDPDDIQAILDALQEAEISDPCPNPGDPTDVYQLLMEYLENQEIYTDIGYVELAVVTDDDYSGWASLVNAVPENQSEEDEGFSTSGGSESEMIDTGAGAPYHDSIPSCP